MGLGFSPWVGKIPWRRKWQSALVFLPENSMDREAWQATVHGVSKNQIQLSTHAGAHVQGEKRDSSQDL